MMYTLRTPATPESAAMSRSLLTSLNTSFGSSKGVYNQLYKTAVGLRTAREIGQSIF